MLVFRAAFSFAIAPASFGPEMAVSPD